MTPCQPQRQGLSPLCCRLLVLACAITVLAGCASTSAPVAWTHEPGCFTGALPASYTLIMHNMPGYFAPIMAEGVDDAMGRRGIKRAAFGADIRVIMDFEMVDMNAPPPEKDPMGEPLLSDTTMDFLARVDLTVRDPAGVERWSGMLSRMHSIRGDEVIHRPRAKLMIGTAIDELFADFPQACSQ